MKIAKQKKVLILGGITHMIEVVETAKKMGLYTIVTDNNVGSPAKKFADKIYDINAADTEKLVDIVNREHIDGIFTAFDDIHTWNALKLCKKLNLPFYATNKNLAITSNKEKFKDFCQTFNVRIIEKYSSDVGLWNNTDLIVNAKRVSNRINRKIPLNYGRRNLPNTYISARRSSESDQIIVRRYVDRAQGREMSYTV